MKPVSRRPLRKAVTKCATASDVALCKNPMVGFACCCARAASGHASAAEQRDELAPPIKKTRSHGTIAKRVGLAKRPKLANGLPFSSSRIGRKGRCVTHSITSSARCWRNQGRSRPSALAVLRLIARSNLVGCTIGNSAGFDPLRIFPA